VALPKGKGYFGRVLATFDVKRMPEKDKPLFMDFYGIHVEELLINHKKIDKQYGSFSNGTIDLSKGNALKNGTNTVVVNFFNEYRNDGFGFHSFHDQVDQQQYIYTKFEPAFCHYVFPNFD
jgi:aminopeptidase N